MLTARRHAHTQASSPATTRSQPVHTRGLRRVTQSRASPAAVAAATAEAQQQQLQLDHVRAHLLRQEDTIIFGWVRRGAYLRNSGLLAIGTSSPARPAEWQPHHSALSWFLEQTERAHAAIGRYRAPDELPFTRQGAEASAAAVAVGPSLAAPPSPLPAFADDIDFNAQVMASYLDVILDEVADVGEDDSQHGTCLLLDVAALQALSKRVHFGKYVAEAKFRQERALFEPLIATGDRHGVRAALTHPAQEDAVASRVARKAAQMLANEAEAAASLGEGGAGGNGGAGKGRQPRLTAEAVARLWRDVVMPLTKDVQVAYLMRRLEVAVPPGGGGAGGGGHHFLGPHARGGGHLGQYM